LSFKLQEEWGEWMRKASVSPLVLPMAEDDLKPVPSKGWAEMIRKVYEVDPLG